MKNSGDVTTFELDARELGLDQVSLDDLQGGEPAENADMIRAILNGEKGPKQDVVLVNAAAGIVVGGKAQNLKEGLMKAVESLESGAALNVLMQLIK